MVATLKNDQVWDDAVQTGTHCHFEGRAPPSSIFPKEGGSQVGIYTNLHGVNPKKQSLCSQF
jgi:hypothetical protein